MTITITIPSRHALDWMNRAPFVLEDQELEWDEKGNVLSGPYTAIVVKRTARTVTLELGPESLKDLISDATYYAEEMSRENTGDIDYRPPARACLRGIERAGVQYTIDGFTVRLDT